MENHFAIHRKIVLVFLIVMALSTGTNAQTESFFQTLELNRFAVDSVDSVADDRFNNALWNDIDTTLYVKNNIILEFNEDIPWKLDTLISCSVDVEIQSWGAGDTVPDIDTITLQVDYDTLMSNPFVYRDMYSFTEKHKIIVKLLTIQISPSSIVDVVQPLMRLRMEIDLHRLYNFDCLSKSVISHYYSFSGTHDKLSLSWTPIAGATSYDLEWTFYDDWSEVVQNLGSYSSYESLFKNNCSRITTRETFDTISLIYPSGYIFYRVRGVKTNFNKDRLVTAWTDSTVNKYQNGWHEEDLNWQYNSVFAEEGKRKEVVNYFDGSLRKRQQVTQVSTNHESIAGDIIYDREGRPIVEVLPVPTFDESIHFFHDFNLNTSSQEYSETDIDPETCIPTVAAMDSNSGAALYYSQVNPLYNTGFNSFVPEAFGFPFSVTQYTPDNTNKIAVKGSVGASFQPGTGHETKYFYGKPSQEELDRLFGNDAGYDLHYTKDMVVDANGQISVSYKDAHDRVIATALAGVTPDNLDELPNRPDAEDLTRDLLKNIEKNAPKMEVYYPLLVTNEAEFHFVYKLFPGSFEDLGCEDTEYCYDCLYDMSITITDDCGNVFNSGTPFTLTKQNYTLNDYDTSCSEAPSAIQDSFDLVLPVGSYNIHQELTIHAGAMDYYAGVFMETHSCKNLQDFIEEAIAQTDFSGCNFTCDSCLTRLGTLAEYVEEYIQELIDKGMTPITQDTLDAHEGYEQLTLVCNEICNETFDACNARYTLMKADVTPGGQYATYETDIYNNYTAPDSTSIFHPNSNVYYKNPDISWIVNGSPITVKIDGLCYSPASLNIEQFINHFESSWADVLVQRHPEYCYYVFCAQNEDSYLYDQRMLLTESYDQAVDSGYFDPLNTTGTNSNPDPFYTTGSGDTTGLYSAMLDYPLSLTPLVTCTATFNIWQIASLLALHVNYSCSDPIPDISTACEGDKNAYWLIFRSMYLWLKEQNFAEKELEFVNGDCISGHSFCNTCIGYNIPIFNEIGHSQSTCGFATEMVCITGILEKYRDKVPRFYHAGTDLVSQINSISSANSYVQDSMASQCASQCSSYVYSWMVALAGCENYSASWSSTDSLELANRLVAVCQAGCDTAHPLGSSSVAPGTTSATYHDISFQQVLNDVLPGSTGKIDCNASLIALPVNYESGTMLFDSTTLGPGNTLYPYVPPCVCENLDSIFTIFTSITASTDIEEFSDWLDTTYQSSMSSEDITMIMDICNDPDCHHLPQEIVIPDVIACTTVTKNCSDCRQMEQALNLMYQTYPGLYWADTAVQEVIMTNWLNNYFGFHLIFDDYIDFINDCEINTDTLPCASLINAFNAYYDNMPVDTPMALFFNIQLDRFFTLNQWINYLGPCRGHTDTLESVINCEGVKLAYDEFTARPGYQNIPNLVDSLVNYFHANYWPHLTKATIKAYLLDSCVLFERNLLTFDCDSLEAYIDDFSVDYGEVIYYSDSLLTWLHLNYYPQFSTAYILAMMDTCNSSFEPGPTCDEISLAYGIFLNTGLIPDSLENWMNNYFTYSFSEASYLAWIDHCGMQEYEQEQILCDELQQIPHDTIDCVDELMQLAIGNGTHNYEVYLDSLSQVFNSQYLATCMEAPQSFKASAPLDEYHYTLYYYDQGDNLVKTVPPAGVHIFNNDTIALVDTARQDTVNFSPFYSPHVLATNYFYNTLNKVWKQYTPDGDTTWFWYDKVGRLVASRNSEQKLNNAYSYSRYDALSRIIQTGMTRNSTALTDAISLDSAGFLSWVAAGTKTEVTSTYYDVASLSTPNLTQENLRGRVASTTYEDSYDNDSLTYLTASHYTYDIAGNVTTLLQENRFLQSIQKHLKRIDYEFDLHSGKVNKVFYQRDSADQFIHWYEYDADNRLIQVHTGTDDIHWDQDAQYQYYRHGPLARTEIGRRQVQGVDYAYTLQGWLKMINNSYLDTLHDMGMDALAGSAHEIFANDIYSLSLGYYTDDYAGIDPSLQPEMPYQSYGFGTNSKSLYNGNIMHATYGFSELDTLNGGSIYALGYHYFYDQLNRLTGMHPWQTKYSGNTNWSWSGGSTISHLKEAANYDPNGNITSYFRNGNPNAPGFTGLGMDSMYYSYYAGTNRLNHVDDSVPASHAPDDIDDQASNNYQYDAIGNLNYDAFLDMKIIWNNMGKLDSINKVSAGVKLGFDYDPSGNRIRKAVYSGGHTNETFYVRDAQGNIMATYSYTDKDSLWLDELDVYGSSRLGLINAGVLRHSQTGGDEARAVNYHKIYEGKKQYELTNHLGNVLSTISDRKFAVDVNNDAVIDYFSPVVLSQNDYYPFGMMMPGRKFNAWNYKFGYNGQEKDDEIKGEGNQISFKYRTFDSRLGRFLSIDPLASKYPYNSPYAFAENKIGLGKELEGLELFVFGNSSIWAASRPIIEVATRATIDVSPIPGPGPIGPILTIPDNAIEPYLEQFEQAVPSAPDATATAPSTPKGPIVLEAKPKQKTEAELDIEKENKKLKHLDSQKDKKNLGRTKENTKGQEKEIGEQEKGLKDKQQLERKNDRPNFIEKTDKSEQKTDNDLKDFKNEYNQKDE